MADVALVRDNDDLAMGNPPIFSLRALGAPECSAIVKELFSELFAAPESLELLRRHLKVRITFCLLCAHAKDSTGLHNTMYLYFRIWKMPGSLLRRCLHLSLLPFPATGLYRTRNIVQIRDAMVDISSKEEAFEPLSSVQYQGN